MQITGWRKGLIVGVGVVAVQAFVTAVPYIGGHAEAQATAHSVTQGRGVDSSQYLKAEALVNNGDAAEGRAIVDSLLESTKPGTLQYAEGLYWRAKLSSSAERAQKDYLRVIVDYSASPRVPDALLNIGQLEFVRGERDKALRHFDQLRKDYPGHALQASASYWVARTLLEGNDLQRGCSVNAEALAQVKSGNVELKNRIEFQNQRCRGVDLAAADSGAQSEGEGQVSKDDGAAESADLEPVKEVAAGDTKAGAKTGAKSSASTKSTAAAASAASGEQYAVQVAAFKTKAQATTLVESLRKKGYTARIDGAKAPYRVKIGKFASRASAEAMLAELRARNIDGFITKG